MRYIFILFVLISCSNNNNLHLSNLELLDDIMIEHDELMMEMKDLKNFKNALGNRMEENLEDQYKDRAKIVIDNLDDAHNSMMSFMKEFSDVFPFDSYPMSKEKHKNMSDEELKDVNNKLKSFQDKIIIVSEKFSSSKQRASRMLN
tara:strand:- start:1612 stop:2049 length:438 start_codon:yes stop_codon:yes gene_type:complete